LTVVTGRRVSVRRTTTLLAFVCLSVSSCASFGPSTKSYVYRQVHMGMEVRMTMEAADEATARQAGMVAFAVIAGLDQQLSDYRDDSVVRAIERAAPDAMRVEPQVFEVLRRAMDVAKASNGAFDPTVAPLVALWRTSRASRTLPAPDALAAARRLVGWSRLELDESAMTVRLPERGMRLDLGGIAKGYILQLASDSLRSAGIASALVEAGGDMVFLGARTWKAQVGAGCSVLGAVHGAIVLGAEGALSTSGASAQFVEIDGVRYSHVVDPRTGLGLTDQQTVHVRAADGATADAWATALGVIGPARAKDVRVPDGVTFCFALS
jgi:thiamine biosynthesis lipoprotein